MFTMRKKRMVAFAVLSVIVFYLLFIRGYSPEIVIRRHLLLSLQWKAAFQSEITYRGTDPMYGEYYVVPDVRAAFYWLGKDALFGWKVLDNTGAP